MVEQLREGKLPRRQLVKALTAIGVSTVGVNAIVASAENPSAAKPSPTVDVTEDSTTHLQMHDQHLANQTQGNTSELHHDYAEHPLVEARIHPAPLFRRPAII